MMNHLFMDSGEINNINLKENYVRMMGAYHLYESLECLIEQLDYGR